MTEIDDYRRAQARAYLTRVSECQRTVRAMRDEVDVMRRMADGMKGIDYSRTRVDASPTDSAIPDAVAMIIERERELLAKVAECVDVMAECDAALDRMGGWEAAILRDHYCAGVSLTELGETDEWRHDRFYMSALHAKALVKFYGYMPVSERDPMHPAL